MNQPAGITTIKRMLVTSYVNTHTVIYCIFTGFSFYCMLLDQATYLSLAIHRSEKWFHNFSLHVLVCSIPFHIYSPNIKKKKVTIIKSVLETSNHLHNINLYPQIQHSVTLIFKHIKKKKSKLGQQNTCFTRYNLPFTDQWSTCSEFKNINIAKQEIEIPATSLTCVTQRTQHQITHKGNMQHDCKHTWTLSSAWSLFKLGSH